MLTVDRLTPSSSATNRIPPQPEIASLTFMQVKKPRNVVDRQAPLRQVSCAAQTGKFRAMTKRGGKPAIPSDSLKQCGLRLRAARLALGYPDIKKFAEVFDSTETAMGNYERGDRLCPPLLMIKIFERDGITLEWIYGGSLRGMPSDMQMQLEKIASEIGAVVGATVARWPMQDDGLVRRPSGVPPRMPTLTGTLHEPIRGLEEDQAPSPTAAPEHTQRAKRAARA